jgi:predicted small integral membrane protein
LTIVGTFHHDTAAMTQERELPSMSASPDASSRGLSRLGTLPVVVATFTLITAAYYTLVAFSNITDFGTNQEFVKHVFAMDTTFNDPDVTWRSIGSSVVQNIAYVLIIAWEVLIALVLLWAFVAWVGALRAGGGYDRPRRLSTLGWTMVLLLFAGGFIVIGGEWFVMWQSNDWNGLDPALQNVIIAGLALILAHLPSGEWQATGARTDRVPVSERSEDLSP